MQTTTTTSCTPLAPQIQTKQCPAGQTGVITETRTSTCPGPTWGAWVTTTNTCTTPPPPPQNVGACTYKGQTYAEGQTVASTPSVSLFSLYGSSFLCDNGSWTVIQPSSAFWWTVGASICDGNLDNHDSSAWCNGSVISAYPIGVAVQPRHGRAQLTVTMRNPIRSSITCQGLTVQWGDGTSGSFPSGGDCSGGDGIDTRTHTYTGAGPYILRRTYDTGATHTANIRVDPATTGLAPNQTQLASALAALESALKAFLKLLGQ